VLGLILGSLLTLIFFSTLRYYQHRDDGDRFAAFYGLVIAISIAQINGVLNTHVWASVPEMGDYANNIFPVIAVGCTLLFLQNVCTLSTRYPRYDLFLAGIGWSTIASVLIYAFFDRLVGDAICTFFLLIATTTGVIATLLSWRSGSVVGGLLVMAFVPQFFAVMRLLLESLGLLPTLWEARYFTSLSVSLSVPILVYALIRNSRDRLELEKRAEQLPTQDALTGLLNPVQFSEQLESAYRRVVGNGEPVALVLVTIVNFEHIVKLFGTAVGEQCVLRAAVKLHRILRDVDPAGRCGDANFSLLLEGVTSRETLTKRMVKLVGSGLIPLPGLKPEVTLQFQIACVLLHEYPVPPESALKELENLLATMGPRTRRPIRFLDAPNTRPMVRDDESSPIPSP
jgi:diguanylate cyclase (GGDEF)-like protein